MSAIDEFMTVEAHNGFGDGSGRANGKGTGCGDGYGFGSGSGYGSGSGSSYGYGYGRGYGEGSGSGYGTDDGYDIQSYCGHAVYRIDDIPTLLYHVHGNIAKGAILQSDLTLKPCYVVKSGNLYAHGETLRDAQAALQDKLFEDMPVEERIQAFLAEFKPGIEYPAKEFYVWHHRLTGSCEMGRKAFAKGHGIDIEHGKMTLEAFLELTKNAYGGDVIRAVIKSLGEKAGGTRTAGGETCA